MHVLYGCEGVTGGSRGPFAHGNAKAAAPVAGIKPVFIGHIIADEHGQGSAERGAFGEQIDRAAPVRARPDQFDHTLARFCGEPMFFRKPGGVSMRFVFQIRSGAVVQGTAMGLSLLKQATCCCKADKRLGNGGRQRLTIAQSRSAGGAHIASMRSSKVQLQRA